MILVDANIFMYAAGASHQYKSPSLKFLHDVVRLEHECCINGEILQEILHRYRSINRWEEGRDVYSLAKKIVPIIEPITREILDKTVELMDAYPSLMARDCLHAAHCILSGLDGICSFDRDFDIIEGIRRIEPSLS